MFVLWQCVIPDCTGDKIMVQARVHMLSGVTASSKREVHGLNIFLAWMEYHHTANVWLRVHPYSRNKGTNLETIREGMRGGGLRRGRQTTAHQYPQTISPSSLIFMLHIPTCVVDRCCVRMRRKVCQTVASGRMFFPLCVVLESLLPARLVYRKPMIAIS